MMNEYAGSPTMTEESVAKVVLKSRERGRLVRYLEPGDRIHLPTVRVEVEALE